MHASKVRATFSGSIMLSSARTRRVLSAMAFGACVGLMVRPTPAVEYTWSPGGAAGGSGTWNTTTTNWNSGTAAWPSSGTDNDALFAGTAGTVTIQAGGVTANDVSFSTTGYQVTGGPLRLNGANPGTATVTVGSNASAVFDSRIDLSPSTGVSFRKAGPGTLEIRNGLTLRQNTQTPANTVADGTLLLTSGTLGDTTSGALTILAIEGGAIRQTGGTIVVGANDTTTSGRFNVGTPAAYGYYHNSGGTLTLQSGFTSARNGVNNGVMEVSGGTVTVGNINSLDKRFQVAGATSPATMYLTGGSLAFSGTFANQLIVGNTVGGTSARNGQLTIAGTAAVSTTGLTVLAGENIAGGGATAVTGILNLNGGGVLTTAGIVDGGGANASGGRHLSFDGGTLRAAAAFTLSGLTSAQINGGGAKFDTNGFDLTISQALLAPATGLTSVAVSSGGSGYIGAPAVAVTGGGGTGASAVANWDPVTRQVTGITITNPGRGYTSAPTVTLFGGTSSVGTAATLGAVTTGAVTGGGLSKLGLGRLTLSASNTYTGATTINGGTLSLGAAGAFANSSAIVIGDPGSSSAVLDISAKTGTFAFASGQTVGGVGTLRLGAANTARFAGTFAPGNSAGLFTIDSGTTLLSGSTQMEILGTSRGTGYDAVDLINAAALNYDNGSLLLDFGSSLAAEQSYQLFGTGSQPIGGILASLTIAGANYAGLTFTRADGVWTSQGTSAANQMLTFTESTGTLVIVPEPGALALAGLGMATAAWIVSRRGKRSLDSRGARLPPRPGRNDALDCARRTVGNLASA